MTGLKHVGSQNILQLAVMGSSRSTDKPVFFLYVRTGVKKFCRKINHSMKSGIECSSTASKVSALMEQLTPPKFFLIIEIGFDFFSGLS